jgi:lipopolysaccharide transport protein LptA
MWFHQSGTLDLATAAAGHDEQGAALWAELEVLPGPGERPERRRMQSRVFQFRFDEEGHLRRLDGQDGVVAVLEPLKPGPAASRSVRCQQLVASMDPASGELETAEFSGEVELAEAKRRATGQGATYSEAKSALLLTGSPRIVDEEQGSDLRADTIEVGVRSGDVAARENVRHQLTGRGRPGLLGESEPVLLLARFLDYQSAARKGRYRENALLRSGRDEVRAPLIVLEEPAPGRRRLHASGGVASILHPRTGGAQKRGAAPVEARAQEMDYEEARSLVVYKGDVTMRQGDIQTRSPEATLTLTPDGSALEKLVAGEPVEVQQGERRASGTRGTYTPEDETMVLVGEKVILKDPSHQVQGRSLTFHAGDDRILVDGREEVRTEAIFRKEPLRR